MSKRIILSLILILISLPIFSQSSAGRFSLKDIDTYWESKIPNSTYWIPKFRPFGTSTVFVDSASYVTLNKGFYAFDSIKTDRDLVVKGAVVLDTNRLGKIQYRGNGIYFSNDKAGGNMTFQLMDDASGSAGDFTWLFGNYLTGQTGMTLDSATGLTINNGNIQVSGTTQQIKLPSDTASDYDANDNITLNRQRGILTTKSLTTAVNAEYNLTLTNSLITTASTVLAFIQTGSLSQGTPIIRAANPSSGSVAIVFRNIDPTNAINGNIKITFVVFN